MECGLYLAVIAEEGRVHDFESFVDADLDFNFLGIVSRLYVELEKVSS